MVDHTSSSSSSSDHHTNPLYYDLPPDSFWLSSADEQDWFDRHAVMQRKTSLKLGGNASFNNNHKKSSFIMQPHHANNNRKSSSSLLLQQQANSKASRKSFGPDRRRNSKPLFRSRSEPNKPPPAGTAQLLGQPVSDPDSPRVSCIGRIGVRSRTRSGDISSSKKSGGFSKLLGSLFGSGAAAAKNRMGQGRGGGGGHPS